MELFESQRREIDHTIASDQLLEQDQLLLQEQLSEQSRELREAHEKSLNEMEELKRFQGSTFDEFSRRRLIEDRDTNLELTAKIQKLHNEIHCMHDSRDFKMLNQYAVDNPTLPVDLSFPTCPRSWRKAKPFCWRAEPQRWAAKHLDTDGKSGNFFVIPTASSSAPYPQELNPWSSYIS